MSQPRSVRNLRSKATGLIIPKEKMQLIAGGIGMAISMRAIFAIAKWRKLNRIEKKVSNL